MWLFEHDSDYCCSALWYIESFVNRECKNTLYIMFSECILSDIVSVFWNSNSAFFTMFQTISLVLSSAFWFFSVKQQKIPSLNHYEKCQKFMMFYNNELVSLSCISMMFCLCKFKLICIRGVCKGCSHIPLKSQFEKKVKDLKKHEKMWENTRWKE